MGEQAAMGLAAALAAAFAAVGAIERMPRPAVLFSVAGGGSGYGARAAAASRPMTSGVRRPERGAHPTPLDYVRVGLALAVVTLIEVGVYYVDAIRHYLAPILIALSALKFSLVVLWFMHLRFDSRLFSTMFVGGLALALAVFAVVLATLGASLV
ncbi:MAG TPA: cytochrome C oxidase subunit IV family protein [Dehalococcoidia bacterium]|nr:cytochrome C oxidase subunit IV family protein [Dehalococcoidia bacterium]